MEAQADSVPVIRPALGLDSLLDPVSDLWDGVPQAVVALAPTPIEEQTSPYVRAVWKGRPYGLVREVRVQALERPGQWLALRLCWDSPEMTAAMTDDDVFVDAACVVFASDSKTPVSMGSPDRPVRGWLWRADRPHPEWVRATGPGSSERRGPADGGELRASARWERGRWLLVMAGPSPAERLLAVAIWRGALQERAGLKSYTPRWVRLETAEGARG